MRFPLTSSDDDCVWAHPTRPSKGGKKKVESTLFTQREWKGEGRPPPNREKELDKERSTGEP